MVLHFISFSILVILNEHAEVLEAYVVSEVFVHDLKLLFCVITSGFDALRQEGLPDLILCYIHILWICSISLSSAG